MHYCGYLENGEAFDNTFERGEPFRFILGPDSLIAGMQEAVSHLNMGSKAIAKVPPHLGYGEGRLKKNGKRELPPKIPANATLTYHIELLGSF
jgi:FKBP-type peptidyl-prolyl cis-trans isomerase